jgi:hypothetical protein
MAVVTYPIRDGSGAIKYARAVSGDGSLTNPYIFGSAPIISWSQPLAVAVTAAGGIGLPANTQRQNVVIVNRGANPVDMFYGIVGVFGAGLPLAPNQERIIDASNLYLGLLSFIANTGLASNLVIYEAVTA